MKAFNHETRLIQKWVAVIKGKVLLSIYGQLCVVQYGGLGR